MDTTSVRPGQIQLQVMSDLHLETPRFMPMYDNFNITPRCPNIALLGDIGSVHDARLFSFLEAQLAQFEIVFYVLGNHEPYGLDTHEAAVIIMEDFEAANVTALSSEREEKRLGRFIFLNRRRFDLSDTVTVLGATLFSHISDEQRSAASLFISDFSNIRDCTVDAHNAAHATDLAWLNREVEAIAREPEERRVVILTHHSPTNSPRANDPEHLEDDRGVQSAFATDLSAELCWTMPCVRVWAFGHTHFNCDFVVDSSVETGEGKRIVANQRGHGREDSFDFDPDKVITMG